MIVGHATANARFEAAAKKLPPGAAAKIRAALNTPRSRASAAFVAEVRAAQARERVKLDRAPLEAAKAKAHAKLQGEEREAVENSLRTILGKSHGILLQLKRR
jgi:hypothetical protein